MMAPTGWLGGHPETGELLCFADRSLSAVEHEQLAAHLTDCEHCQRELSILSAQARTVSASMASLEQIPVSDIRKARAWVAVKAAAAKVERRKALRTVWVPRLAAAALVLVAGSVLAGPGMALVRTVFAGPPGPPAPLVAEPIVVMASEAGSVLLPRFTLSWDRPDFMLTFRRVGGGTVEFRRGDPRFVSIEMTGRPDITSGPIGPSIENDVSGSPVYVITLPTTVTSVTVSVGGGPPRSWQPESGILYSVKDLAVGRLTRIDPKKKP